MIFESHAHYDDERFDSDRVELLSLMKQNNIERIINVGSSLNSCRTTLELAGAYDFISAAIGVHPSDISCLETEEDGMHWIYETAKKSKEVVAIGEIGLDYYWDKEEDVQKKQRQRFLEQLDIAQQLDLPVIIHSREAAEETLSVMKDAAKKGIRGVIHCYSYSPEIAKEYVKLGYYIGVGGVVTFKNAKKLKETVKQIPLKSILTETDCPYMAPSPFRGRRNDSTYIPYVIHEIATLRETTDKEVMDVTCKNGYELFHRIKK